MTTNPPISTKRLITPKLSVLTPTWNRGYLLQKVYHSLLSQGDLDLEWIIVNDGSSDDTHERVMSFLADSRIPIIYAQYDLRVGKAKADNLLLNLARGTYITWCDSDDSFLPHTLEPLVRKIDAPTNQSANYPFAVAAFNIDNDGWLQTQGSLPNQETTIPFSEVSQRFQGDMSFLFRKSTIGQHRFPEVDLLITESSLWNNFSDQNVCVIPSIVKTMNRRTENRVSFANAMEYCRGKAYAISLCDGPTLPTQHPTLIIKKYSDFVRYCIHGEISLTEALHLLPPKPVALCALSFLIGSVAALYDLLVRPVRKSHHIFLKSTLQTYHLYHNIDE